MKELLTHSVQDVIPSALTALIQMCLNGAKDCGEKQPQKGQFLFLVRFDLPALIKRACSSRTGELELIEDAATSILQHETSVVRITRFKILMRLSSWIIP